MAIPILGAAVEIVKTIIDRALPDQKSKAEALAKLSEMELNGDLAAMAQQVEILKLDAVSSDKFQSRWRPFIGWVCGCALAIQLVIAPLACQISAIAGRPVPLVVMDVSLLSTMLIGMLGFGGMRTVEKLNKAA